MGCNKCGCHSNPCCCAGGVPFSMMGAQGPQGPPGIQGNSGARGAAFEPIAGQRSNFANYIYAGCGGSCVGFVDCIQFLNLAAGSTGIIETSNDRTSVSSPGVYKIQWRLTIANIPQP